MPEVPLTETGQKLEARYAEQLKNLQSELQKALPDLDAQQAAAFLKAYQEEAAASAAHLKAFRAQAKPKDKDAAAKEFEAAKKALEKATANAQAPSKTVLTYWAAFLASDKLDAQLVKVVVLAEASPRGLAAFAQQGEAQEALVEKLLADTNLMKQMVFADGAKDGKYGEAMAIYTNIQNASAKAGPYALTAKVVTTSAEQHLLVADNDAKEPIDIAAPFTVGMWDKTPPVNIPLVKGPNLLRFSRGGENIKGLTIKEFTLTPVK